MILHDLIPVVVGFGLGLLGGPAKDYITDKQRARRLNRMIMVELQSLSYHAEATLRRLLSAEGAASWYERGMTFTQGWFWSLGDTLALLSSNTLRQLIALRGLLQQLESDYREIEQDVGHDGRVFPREHVLRNFDRFRNDIGCRSKTICDLTSNIIGGKRKAVAAEPAD